MKTITIYGIKNCDTMKKAFAWLEQQALAYTFVDYRQQPPSALQLQNWSARIAWQSLLNTRGSTWRKLDAAQRSDVNEAKALALMVAYPSLIKRPLLDDGVQLWLGFSVAQYTAAFLAESAHARES